MSPQQNDTPAFSLQKFGNNEWKFIYPASLEPLINQFNKVAEDLTFDNAEQALKIFTALKKQLPQYIDIYNLIALIHIWRKEYDQAIEAVESGITHIRELFPEDFFNEQPLVEWANESNRPFLSCLTKLGLSFDYIEQYTDAIEIFEQLMMMNPSDHQGVRNVLLWTYLKADWVSAAKELCAFYQDDRLPALSYGYALTLYKENALEQAALQLATARDFYPDVAEALLKMTTTSPHYDFLTLLEKPDDTKVYINHYGVFWQDTPGALTWLKKVFE